MSVSLHVDILEARNLIDADRSISAMLQSNDTSDPFVSVMLMGFHDDEKEEIGRTEVVKNDVNPVWKYSMVKRHIDMNETGVVRLSVRDYDQFSKDSKLGNVDLPMLGLIGKGNVEGWFKLQRTHKMQKQNKKTSGDLRIAIKITYESVNLSMTIIRGKDILDMDQSMFVKSDTDVSDPFVVAMLRSEKKNQSRVLGRTAVMKDKKNPVWNYDLVEQDIDLREMKTIRLDVRDKDTYTRDSKIGYVDIDIVSLYGKPEVTSWYKIHPLKDKVRGAMEVRVRVYDKGDEDENVGDNIVSSHYMSNEDGDRVLLVEREDVFGISRRFEMFDLRLITKCEIQGGDEKVTDLRYLTTSGHSGSLFLSAKHSKLFKSSIERAKKNHDSADDNIFDVTIEAFCRDRKTGRGGEFCVIAISSLRAIIASDFETHSIHEIKNVSADSSKFQIVNKDGKRFSFKHDHENIKNLVNSMNRSSYIAKWKESRRLFLKNKLETQNAMEHSVERVGGPDGLVNGTVDYSKVSSALLHYTIAYNAYYKHVIRPEHVKEWEKQKKSNTASVRCYECEQYIPMEMIDTHYKVCTKVKPKSESENLYDSDISDVEQTFMRPLMAIVIRKLTSRNKTTTIKVPNGLVDIVNCVGIERGRKLIMQILLNDYGTKVGMRYGSQGSNLSSPSTRPGLQLRGWDDRIEYFMNIMRSLGYSDDEDEDVSMLFPENWKIGQIYAKNFVRLTKKDLNAIFKRIHAIEIKRGLLRKKDEDKEKEEEEDPESVELFQANVRAAKTSKRVESFLDQVFFCPDDEIMKLPGDSEKYDQFKGQFLQYFERHLGTPLLRSFKDIRKNIRKLCDLKVEECTTTSRIYDDMLQITAIIKKYMDLIMNIAPGATLRDAVKLLCFTPSEMSFIQDHSKDEEKKEDDEKSGSKKRSIFDWDGDGKLFELGFSDSDDESVQKVVRNHKDAGILHEYAEALRFRLPGESTKSLKDDVVNETTFVVYNTVAMMVSNLLSLSNTVSETIMDKYVDAMEISFDGVCQHFENVARDASERITNLITSDVNTVMRRDPMFLELFQKRAEDEMLRKYHTSSFENGVRRHVTKLMSSLQYSPRRFMKFVRVLAMKLPRMYMDYIKAKCSPLTKIAAEQALLDIEAMTSFLSNLPTNVKSLSPDVREKYERYFSTKGKYALKAHVSIVSQSLLNLKRAINVTMSKKSLRDAMMEHFPGSRYLLDENDDEEKEDKSKVVRTRRQRRREITRLRHTAELILQLKRCSETKQKHELVNCGLIDGNSEDMLGKISISVSGKIFFVKVDVAGYQFNILKREDEFLGLVKAAKELQKQRKDAKKALDVPDPSSFFYSFNMLKSREEKLAPEFEELVQSMVEFATKASYTFVSLDEFLETESLDFRAHLVTNSSDAQENDTVTVHLSCNRIFHFSHIPIKRFVAFQKILQTSARGVPDPSRCLKRNFRRDDLNYNRELVRDLILLAAKQYRMKKRRDVVCVFFGRKVVRKLKLLRK